MASNFLPASSHSMRNTSLRYFSFPQTPSSSDCALKDALCIASATSKRTDRRLFWRSFFFSFLLFPILFLRIFLFPLFFLFVSFLYFYEGRFPDGLESWDFAAVARSHWLPPAASRPANGGLMFDSADLFYFSFSFLSSTHSFRP